MKKVIIKSISIFSITLIIAFQITSFSAKVYRNNNLPESPQSTQNTILKLKQAHPQDKNTIRLMTYNILSDEPGFEGSPAYTRAKSVCSLLNNLSPDVAGIQEMSRSWFYYLNANTQYSFVLPVKTALTASMTAIIYNPEKLILKNCGEKALTRGSFPRLRKYIWATFETTNTKSTFTVVNTHFSLNNNNSYTPMLQAFDLIDFSKEFKHNHPLFFVGDFNTTPNTKNDSSRVYEILSTNFTDTKLITNSLSEGAEKSSSATFVDHIFLKGSATIKNFIILSNKDFTPLSDHYPILADVIIKC